MFRRLTVLAALCLLTACANRPDPDERVEPIGDFRLGHNIVVAQDVTQGPMSRDATEAELEEALRQELETRLRRYDGNGLYHLGVKIEGYALAQPGIPLVLAPKSIFVLAFNVWDNETQERVNDEPIRVTAFEGANTGVPLVPSGLVKSREQQLENLSISAAQQIEEILRENADVWFAPTPGDGRTPFPPVAGGEVQSEAVVVPSN